MNLLTISKNLFIQKINNIISVNIYIQTKNVKTHIPYQNTSTLENIQIMTNKQIAPSLYTPSSQSHHWFFNQTTKNTIERN